jgi:uncharacterized protein YbjT (DUF2867 family)
MADQTYIFLAGASRGVGREIAQILVQKQQKIKALLRPQTDATELEAMGINVVTGDALDIEAVERAMMGEGKIAAVISTVGGLPKDGERADYLGNKNLIDGAVKAGVRKFILVSSIGSGQSAIALPPQAMATLAPVLAEKEKAEEHLIASGLTYVIVRPGGLKSEPATGDGVLTESYQVAGTIHRADVAQLVVGCLFSEVADNKILSAVDKNMLYGNLDFEELKL